MVNQESAGCLVAASLTQSHSSFETPCGSYAHFKLTRDPRYGDSMERRMYNTVLGAKPIQADGRTFYYSDYNFKGCKVYSEHRWACCSGTLPQVAADYRINTYFRDSRSVYVNLYISSTLRCTQDGAQAVLTQKSTYPFDSMVQFDVQTSQVREFAISFRIPGWAKGASISVNGRRVQTPTAPGSLASVRRQWNTGDGVEVDLPMMARIESIDPQHPQTVTLLVGPLVLFAITDAQPVLDTLGIAGSEKIGSADLANQNVEWASQDAPVYRY